MKNLQIVMEAVFIEVALLLGIKAVIKQPLTAVTLAGVVAFLVILWMISRLSQNQSNSNEQ